MILLLAPNLQLMMQGLSMPASYVGAAYLAAATAKPITTAFATAAVKGVTSDVYAQIISEGVCVCVCVCMCVCGFHDVTCV